MIRSVFSTTIAAGLAASAAIADTALYAEPHPKDASYVRFIGFDAATEVVFAGKTFIVPDAAGYIPVSAALLQGVEAGLYTTVIQHPTDHPLAIVEHPRKDLSRVHLFLINATDTPVSLRTIDGATKVIDRVAPSTSGTRAVNPLAIPLAVYSEVTEQPIATFELSLRRGQNLSFIVDIEGVQLVENHYAPVAR